ncbi:MAG: HlyD family efflux transporter periplasmic adaptor subunit [Leptolyngbyaceae cyanobacterium SM2_3_12]|nr:HlyD family efflux transporter periplasmic adaptor subunit [Leptolyngbyaceae cyanobacterium SM2_3_12]
MEIAVTDSNLPTFTLGQSLTLQIDAFAGETFRGQVTRISPVADSISRQVPVEITLANPGNRIGSGLLARVNGASPATAAVLVPQGALETAETSGQPEPDLAQEQQIFVVSPVQGAMVAEARTVRIGEQSDGKVAIVAGLSPGEKYVVRSSQPLQSGQVVEPSMLSDI